MIALSSTAEVAIALREAEVATEEATGISEAEDAAIPEVVPLAETTIGTEDGNPHHAPPHVASASTQGQGLPLPVGTLPVTWTGTTGARATSELLSDMASLPPFF